jgi:hypothetical protein
MRFNLKRPCAHCPFRSDVKGFLNPERAEEITTAVLQEDKTFTCHETITGEHDLDDDGIPYAYHPGAEDQHCAGALILIEKTRSANQMVQLAERLGLWDKSKMHFDAPVFETAADMIAAQN